MTATGDPPGERPTESLVVHLRGAGPRRAEVRLWAGPAEPARLILVGASGDLDPGTARPTSRSRPGSSAAPADGPESVTDLPDWDRHAAILSVLADAVAGPRRPPRPRRRHPRDGGLRGGRPEPPAGPDGRAALRGDQRGRDVQERDDVGRMPRPLRRSCSSLPVALAGPALGIGWTIYIAYAIPPLLVAFVALQFLRFAIRERPGPQTSRPLTRPRPIACRLGRPTRCRHSPADDLVERTGQGVEVRLNAFHIVAIAPGKLGSRSSRTRLPRTPPSQAVRGSLIRMSGHACGVVTDRPSDAALVLRSGDDLDLDYPEAVCLALSPGYQPLLLRGRHSGTDLDKSSSRRTSSPANGAGNGMLGRLP